VTFYALTLFLHSLLRWVLLALAVFVCLRSFIGWLRRRTWQPLDERLHVALVGVVDTQFLLGLVLYGLLSPFSRTFWLNIATGMKDPILRFYGIEHVFAMLIAVTVLHIGRKRSTQAATGVLRHRRAWTSILAALAIMAVSIPWPDLPYGRPLFRPLW
jgi:hypothetical protein